MTDLQPIGKRIKAARQSKKLTQQELAELADLSTTYISAMERGKKTPKLETLVKLANILNVSTDYLLADVVEASLKVVARELSEQLKSLPLQCQKEILHFLQIVTMQDKLP